MTPLPRPTPDEHDPYYGRYIERAAAQHGDVLSLLRTQLGIITALGALPDEKANHAYGPGKWTVKEVLGHLADVERVFAYRALRFARGDATDLPGFDENTYVPAGRFGARDIGGLAAELTTVRHGSLALFQTFDADMAKRRGTANGSSCSARAAVWIVAGHFAHHVAILEDRYGVSG